MEGTIFSIEEFAVYDGEGIRVNVFFKGCPLRCQWCHNPEGFSTRRQIVRSPNGCLGCGECRNACSSPENCLECGACILACPRRLIRFSGERWDAQKLAARILRLKPILDSSGGGVTFSGGEVLLQPDFLCELLEATSSLHRAIETCGYASEETFRRVLSRVDFVFFDLKVMDPQRHRQYTGKDNELILKNARILMESGVPYTFRVPFIHEVNTNRENLEQMRDFLSVSSKPVSIEFLAYNQMAGSKYKMLGKEYVYDFTGPTEEDKARAQEILKNHQVRFRK